MSPLVSAIIPTKNRVELLDRALKSVLNQSYKNIELVVVNDASTDGTSELLQTYKKNTDLLLTVIENEQSAGAAKARNQAIEKSNGMFIAGLDDDDVWHADRVSELITNYSDHCSCITSDTIMVYPKFKARWKKKKRIDLDTLLYTNQVGNQVLVKRSRLLAVGGFDETLPAAQDYDLWVRLCAEFGPIRNVKKPLQTIFMDHESERITEHSSFDGYLQFYSKHKHRMNREQRKYQLYKIRRTQQKPESIREFIRCVPAFRLWKEMKQSFLRRALKT